MPFPAPWSRRLRHFLDRWYLAGVFAIVLGLLLWRNSAWIIPALLILGAFALWRCDLITRWQGGRKLRAHCGPVLQVRFENGGDEIVATHQTPSGTACVRWNTRTHQVITAGVTGPAAGSLVVASPDGNWRAAADGRVIRLQQHNAPKTARTLRGHSRQVNSLDIAPDSTRLASGGEDGLVIIWHLHA